MREMILVVVMLAAGCGSPQPTAQHVCERFGQLCEAKDSVAECTQNLTDLKGEMKPDAYGKMLSCTGGADTCGEWLGCALGGLSSEADPQTRRQIDGLGKGLRRMLDKEIDKRDTPRTTTPRRERDTVRDTERDTMSDDEAPLPPQCALVDELCDRDETLVRDQCKRMVRNIRSDTASLGKLSACFAEAKNCYALDNCLDQLWFELH